MGINLDTLLSQSEFCKLKLSFLLGHVKYSDEYFYDQELRLQVNLAENDIFRFDENGNRIDQNFFEDFLKPEISKIPERIFDALRKEIKEKGIYGDSALSHYVASKTNELLEKRESISHLTHLPDKIKSAIYDVIDEVYNYLKTEFIDAVSKVKKKIPLNLSKIQIILLFYLLSEGEIANLDEIDKKDLLLKLEDVFEYYDNSSKQYKPLRKTRKYYNELLNDHKNSKPIETALESLRKLLTSDDFFAP